MVSLVTLESAELPSHLWDVLSNLSLSELRKGRGGAGKRSLWQGRRDQNAEVCAMHSIEMPCFLSWDGKTTTIYVVFLS